MASLRQLGRLKRRGRELRWILISSIVARKEIPKLPLQKYPNLEDQNQHHQNQQHHQFPFYHHYQNNNNRNVDDNEDNDDDERDIPQPQYEQQQQNLHELQQYYAQQQGQGDGGHHLRELFNQIETQNLGPICENSQPVKKRSYLASSLTSVEGCTPNVRQKATMGGEDSEGFQLPQPVSTRSALRRAGVGEIVEVQGGHIVRATGRKDRHSKVCTAKGPRDRRVRLAAHTAIQFYDVQDRLGYDRPSKAVDWLIKKAKAAIDELDQLPAWSPTSMNISSTSRRRGKGSGGDKVVELGEQDGVGGNAGGGGAGMFGGTHKQEHQQDDGQQQQHMYNNARNSGSSLLPPSMDSDAIADTIKSFFPMGGGTSVGSGRQQVQFEDYNHGGGLLSRSGGSRHNSQDLRLSLQSFEVQDPILMHSHSQAAAVAAHDEQQHSLYHGASQVGFENSNAGWADSQHQSSPELGRLHRLVVGWHNHQTNTDQQHSGNGVGLSASNGGSTGGGYMFNQPPLLQPLFGGQQGQYFSQRGPLQSSNTPSVRAWIGDPSIATSSEYHQAIPIHPQALPGLGFPSGGFSGFHIPARIQGEEEHDGHSNKPSSASSGSRH